MTKDEIIKAICDIEGITRVSCGNSPVDMVSGETLLQINVYYLKSVPKVRFDILNKPPDLGVKVSDGLGLKDEVK